MSKGNDGRMEEPGSYRLRVKRQSLLEDAICELQINDSVNKGQGGESKEESFVGGYVL